MTAGTTTWLLVSFLGSALGSKCPLQILGAGFGRTGTFSTKTALESVGLRTYHMTEVFTRPDHIVAWKKHATGEESMDWDWLFDGFDAALDFPVAFTKVWTEIFALCPDVKVLITERDSPEVWVESLMATIADVHARFPFRLVKYLDTGLRNHETMWTHLSFDQFGFDAPRSLTRTPEDRAAAVEAFLSGVFPESTRARLDSESSSLSRRYVENSEVARRLVPDKQLLIWNVKEGWSPLCDFLKDEMDGPCPETPFPRTNDTFEFKVKVWKLSAGLAGGALGVLALLYVLAATLAGSTKAKAP
jgi:hypothetical protein